ALIGRGLPVGERAEFGRIPVNETEALQLSAGAWTNAVTRNQKKIEWQTWAQRKYRRIAEGPWARGEGRSWLEIRHWSDRLWPITDRLYPIAWRHAGLNSKTDQKIWRHHRGKRCFIGGPRPGTLLPARAVGLRQDDVVAAARRFLSA